MKELVDDALDACEEAGVAPVVSVAVADGKIVVTDKGPGIPEKTVEALLDFSVRVSSREAYISPTRGAQGNALKTVIAMPFALDGRKGRTRIEAHGIAHDIQMSVDLVRQEPRFTHTCAASSVTTGTRVTVLWPNQACSKLASARDGFLQMARAFTYLNPHLSLVLSWDGTELMNVSAPDPGWSKWLPSDPIPAHWYAPDQFERLIAAYIGHDETHGRSRTVREFVCEFRGFKGSGKQKEVLAATGLSHAPLSSLCRDGAIDQKTVAALHSQLKAASSPVKPEMLGIIGEEHMRRCCIDAGGEPDSFAYVRRKLNGDTPALIEVAFAYLPKAEERQLIAGVNWSAAINNPFRIDDALSDQRAGPFEPIWLVVHLAQPRPQVRDRGKSSVHLGRELERLIVDALSTVTRRWTKVRKAEERQASASMNRHARLTRSRRVSLKDAAYEVMKEAYLKASANDTLPAHARQIMYQARGYIQERTGRPLDDAYFTQTLLPEYMSDHRVDWDVVSDARGHFHEPHTSCSFGLGTLAVRDYLEQMRDPELSEIALHPPSVITHGPRGRFGAVLFIEKEGFKPLFESVELARRYDLALMSTKGQSVVAARQQVDDMCGNYQVPLLVLHDFDKDGFSIISMLRTSNHRYTYQRQIDVIDLGLRLSDVDAMGLREEAETVYSGKGKDEDARRANEKARRANMIKNGATPEEAEFLLNKRVELNAMPSDVFIKWLEAKLKKHGVRKIVPDANMLGNTWRRTVEAGLVAQKLPELIAEAEKEVGALPVPKDLARRVKKYLRQHPEAAWDHAVAAIARGCRE